MKNTKAFLALLLVMFACIFFISCSFRVISPQPMDPADNNTLPPIDANGKIVVTVRFSEKVKAGSFLIGKTVFLKFANIPSADADLNLSPDLKTLTITTKDPASKLLHFTPDAGFSLTLVGTDTGNGSIRSFSKKSLDGDYDNRPGGDYVKYYFMVG